MARLHADDQFVPTTHTHTQFARCERKRGNSRGEHNRSHCIFNSIIRHRRILLLYNFWNFPPHSLLFDQFLPYFYLFSSHPLSIHPILESCSIETSPSLFSYTLCCLRFNRFESLFFFISYDFVVYMHSAFTARALVLQFYFH